jgi:hypothetical protein
LKKFTLIILIAFVIFSGCGKNPFGTRSSEEPAGSTGTWETPATPEVVLLNFLFAYNEMNIQNYQLCFADNYRFSATEDSIQADAEGNGYLFSFWDKSVEVSTTENIFASFDAENKHLDLILSPSTDYPDSIGDSLAVMYRDYILRIIAADSIGTDTTLIEGLASFSASRSLFNWWSIYLWSELPSQGSANSWADFKAEYRN